MNAINFRNAKKKEQRQKAKKEDKEESIEINMLSNNFTI